MAKGATAIAPSIGGKAGFSGVKSFGGSIESGGFSGGNKATFSSRGLAEFGRPAIGTANSKAGLEGQKMSVFSNSSRLRVGAFAGEVAPSKPAHMQLRAPDKMAAPIAKPESPVKKDGFNPLELPKFDLTNPAHTKVDAYLPFPTIDLRTRTQSVKDAPTVNPERRGGNIESIIRPVTPDRRDSVKPDNSKPAENFPTNIIRLAAIRNELAGMQAKAKNKTQEIPGKPVIADIAGLHFPVQDRLADKKKLKDKVTNLLQKKPELKPAVQHVPAKEAVGKPVLIDDLEELTKKKTREWKPVTVDDLAELVKQRRLAKPMVETKPQREPVSVAIENQDKTAVQAQPLRIGFAAPEYGSAPMAAVQSASQEKTGRLGNVIYSKNGTRPVEQQPPVPPEQRDKEKPAVFSVAKDVLDARTQQTLDSLDRIILQRGWGTVVNGSELVAESSGATTSPIVAQPGDDPSDVDRIKRIHNLSGTPRELITDIISLNRVEPHLPAKKGRGMAITRAQVRRIARGKEEVQQQNAA